MGEREVNDTLEHLKRRSMLCSLRCKKRLKSSTSVKLRLQATPLTTAVHCLLSLTLLISSFLTPRHCGGRQQSLELYSEVALRIKRTLLSFAYLEGFDGIAVCLK